MRKRRKKWLTLEEVYSREDTNAQINKAPRSRSRSPSNYCKPAIVRMSLFVPMLSQIRDKDRIAGLGAARADQLSAIA
jgi:hypothetical protein